MAAEKFDDVFCVACGVAWELHPEDMEVPQACGVAARRAELLDAVARGPRS